jgi:hypothetical protein
MIQARASILVKSPPQKVYDFVVVGFTRNYRRWSPEVQRLDMLTPGPLRVGSRVRQVRVDQGRRSDNTFRVVALEPPTQIRFAESSDQFRTAYRMDPVDNQTRLTFDFELRQFELYMRPFEKLIRVAVQEGSERVVRNIKGLVERESRRAAGGQT